MNKKGPRVDRATAKGGTKNELYVPSSMNPPELKIEIRGESGKLVENFHDLSADSGKNRAVITLSFDGNTGQHQSDDPNKVIYRVVNPNPQSIEEWKKMKKEALADFLINKSNKSFLDVSKHDNSNSDFEYTLKRTKVKSIYW